MTRPWVVCQEKPDAQMSTCSLIQMKMHVCVCAQLCPTLWDTMDSCLPVSSIHGISQARILEWVAISSSRVCSWPKDKTYLLHLLHWRADSFPLCHKNALTPLGENRKQRDSCFKWSVWVICRTGTRSGLLCFRPDRHFSASCCFLCKLFHLFQVVRSLFMTKWSPQMAKSGWE